MYIGTCNNQAASQITGKSVSSINRSAQTQSQSTYGKSNEQAGMDSVTISSTGKNQSMIQQLMDQKQLLQERKQSLLASAAEDGSDNLDKVKEYEEQMNAIDEQISQLQSKDATDSGDDSGDSTGQIYEKPKTKEEVTDEQLSNITALSTGADQTEILSKVKNHLEGRIKVLSGEIRTGNGNTEAKLEAISNLGQRVDDIGSQIAEKLGDSNDTVESSRNSISETEVEFENKAIETLKNEKEENSFSNVVSESALLNQEEEDSSS